MERKRQKKLRQRDQKAREQRHEAEIKGNIDSTVEVLSTAEASTYDFEVQNRETFADNAPPNVPFQCPDTNEGIDGNVHSGYDFGIDQNIERPSARRHNRRRKGVARLQGLPKSQWAVANDLHACQNSPISKIEIIQRYGTHHDQRAATIVSGSKVWSRKLKPEIDRVSEARVEKEPHLVKNHEVLIGSISITLGNCSQSEGNMVASCEDCGIENLANQSSSQEKPMNPDFVQSGDNRSTVKLWRPVSRHETKKPLPFQSGETEADAIYGDGDCQNFSDPSCLTSCSTDGSDVGFENNFCHVEGRVGPGSLQLSSYAAKAFLARSKFCYFMHFPLFFDFSVCLVFNLFSLTRNNSHAGWKEAMSSNHVELVVSSDSEPPGCQEIRDFRIAECQSSEVNKCNILANAENRLPATSKVTKAKPRMKPEKGTKIKYIPKQKTAT